ncbi:hypothetical protein CcaverHIS641_0206850 [Cutaneotrichosporon cavernicola]|nr:hypothetical protein CcaverHIS641_0206850 [Cutaneotrichosporon cavernicola]
MKLDVDVDTVQHLVTRAEVSPNIFRTYLPLQADSRNIHRRRGLSLHPHNRGDLAHPFAGFDIVASKIASFTIALGLLVAGWYGLHWITYVSVVCSEAVLVGMWFGSHGSALRFLGVNHLFYSLWDYLEETVFGKTNPSDCHELQRHLGVPAETWLALIFLFEALVFMAAIMAGIVVFKKTPEQMYADAAGFLPT